MPRLDPQKRVAAATIDVTLPDGDTVTIRRKTLFTLVMCGRLPYSLLKLSDGINARFAGGSEADVASVMSEAEYAEMIAFYRTFACAVAIDPVIAPAEACDGTQMPVEELEFPELIAIFQGAHSPAPLAAPVAAPVLPDLSTEAAREEFRATTPAGAADAAPAREDVSPSPECLSDAGMASTLVQ